MTRVRIAGWAKNLPAKVITNNDLALVVDTSDEWIRSRTGIQERRIAQDDESAASLGAPAAVQALEVAGLSANDVDLIICATATPDRIFPSTASLIQHANVVHTIELGEEPGLLYLVMEWVDGESLGFLIELAE